MAKGLDAEARRLAKAKQSKKERDKRYRSKPEFKIKKAGQNARRRITEAEAKINPNTGKIYKVSPKSFSRSVENLRQGLAGQPEAIKARQGRVAKAQKQIEKTGRAVIPRSPRGGSAIIPTRGHYQDPIAVKGKDADFNITAQDKSSNSRQGNIPHREMVYKYGYTVKPGTNAEYSKENNPNYKTEALKAGRKRAAARKAATAAGAPASKTQMTPQGRIKLNSNARVGSKIGKVRGPVITNAADLLAEYVAAGRASRQAKMSDSRFLRGKVIGSFAGTTNKPRIPEF